MSLQANKDLIIRYYEEMWNAWKLPLAKDLLAEEVVFRGSIGVSAKGISGFRGYMLMVRDAFPDFFNEIELLVAEENEVFSRIKYTGTHVGEIFGLAPTGKHFSFEGAAHFTVQRGKIHRGWAVGDIVDLLKQLGFKPPEGAWPSG
jgi:steroid delta-isomerase-like uncharacterized protein